MLPNNRVEFFVSYYDYYQPEAYIPRTDTYIEKDSSINEEIDRLRHAATSALLTRHDTVVVASVSCIYGLGNPKEYREHMLHLQVGQSIDQRSLLRTFVDMQYHRNDLLVERGSFRVRGDTIEIQPAYDQEAIRLSLFGDDIESISFFNPLTQELRGSVGEVTLFAATHYATSDETLKLAIERIRHELRTQISQFESQGKLLEAQRLRSRTEYDIEMLQETGVCSGVENYSAHLDGRSPGERPFTLLDYFPDDYFVVIDESHVAVPQVRGQFAGDRSRKDTLVEHGFRLPSARDNRPLNFEEFLDIVPQTVFVSATPGPFEIEHSDAIAEQVIRPTGLLDPIVHIIPTKNQIDDLLQRIETVVARNERVLVTTLTKRMAEDLSAFLAKNNVRVKYLHSDIDTIQRIEILRALRLGEFDVLVGINLLREGLDLPEVSLVAILDADKEGFLRSKSALIQTIGRAARNANGEALLYADRITDSMRSAISTTERRRALQIEYNDRHGIKPTTVTKAVADILGRLRSDSLASPRKSTERMAMADHEIDAEVERLKMAMADAAADLRFEEAASLRDLIATLRRAELDDENDPDSD
jgi:excinuclease ABC subunit B